MRRIGDRPGARSRSENDRPAMRWYGAIDLRQAVSNEGPVEEKRHSPSAGKTSEDERDPHQPTTRYGHDISWPFSDQ